ncbi:MAG: sigma-70 family RNA polymerase sigma factor [Planctomycetes bacterium]|nr:sigma-70 family RNA polymerase sigma factor [Planctomycetota bacterium]
MTTSTLLDRPLHAEAELLDALRAGDDGAFELLVREHAPRLLCVVRRIVGSDADAQDVLQDAFLSAFRHLDGFEGGARLGTWLHRIAVNAALMHVRARDRRKAGSIEDLLPGFDAEGHFEEHVAAWRHVDDDVLCRAETVGLVRAAIDALPTNYRTILVLRDLEGLSTEAAAQRLGIRSDAAKVRLHRARQALRARLDETFSE